MDKLILEATSRDERGKAVAKLRNQGLLPVVAYGHGQKTAALSVDAKTAAKVYRQAGGNKLVDLKIGTGKAHGALIHEVQEDGMTGALLHMDLYLVKMDEVLSAEIPLHFVGESTAVYQGEGTLMKNIETVEVECLPANLPESITVDISILDDFEKTITVADLVIPEGVKLLLEDTETLVVKVEPPRSDEELEALESELTDELPEGVAEEDPAVVSEENEGNADRRDKK